MIQSEIDAAKERIHRGHENIKEAKRLLVEEIKTVTKIGEAYNMRLLMSEHRGTYTFYNDDYWADEDEVAIVIKGGNDTSLRFEVNRSFCSLFDKWIENNSLWVFAKNEEGVIMDLKDQIANAEDEFRKQERMINVLERSPQLDVPMPGKY